MSNTPKVNVETTKTRQEDAKNLAFFGAIAGALVGTVSSVTTTTVPRVLMRVLPINVLGAGAAGAVAGYSLSLVSNVIKDFLH